MAFQVIVRRISTNSATQTESKSLNYCINLLQKRAYEQYIATLLLPPKIRRCGFAIRAFNIEISSIRDQVSGRNAGLGRTVFWQELVHKLFESGGSHIPNHPVAKELSLVIKNHKVSQELLQRMIDARDIFLEDDVRPPFGTVEQLEEYGEKAFSSVHFFLLECLLGENQEMKGHARHAANQLGKTEGILTLIRGVPYNASKLGKVYIPINLLADYKVSSESILSKNYEKENLQKLVEALASIAEDHLSNSRFRAKYLTKEEKQILLPAITADRYMTRLSRANCDIFNPQLTVRDSWLPVSLYWNKLRSTY